MIGIVVELSSFDPVESYNQAVLMRNLRRRSQRVDVPNTFWQSPLLKRFANSPQSCLILVRGTFQGRWTLRDIAVRVTEELHIKNIATLWAVNARKSDLAAKSITLIDNLRSLVAQALKLNGSQHSQKSATLCCTQLRTATTENQWFDILGAALSNFCKEMYILLELEPLMPPSGDYSQNSEIIELFDRLFRELAIRGSNLAVKVMVLTCMPLPSQLQGIGNVLSTTMPAISPLRPKQLPKQSKASHRSTLPRLLH
jgi:hypothetical protein